MEKAWKCFECNWSIAQSDRALDTPPIACPSCNMNDFEEVEYSTAVKVHSNGMVFLPISLLHRLGVAANQWLSTELDGKKIILRKV